MTIPVNLLEDAATPLNGLSTCPADRGFGFEVMNGTRGDHIFKNPFHILKSAAASASIRPKQASFRSREGVAEHCLTRAQGACGAACREVWQKTHQNA
jgi:hypothetical protein